MAGEFLGAFDLHAGLLKNFLRAQVVFEGCDLSEQVGEAKPAFDHGLIDFEVELEPVNEVSVTKCLIGAGLTLREESGADRKLEGIAMPLEDSLGVSKILEEGIAMTFLGQPDIGPANFFLCSRSDRGAQFGGNDLRPQTNAEHWNLQLQSASHQSHLGENMGVGCGLPDVHGSSEKDQARIAVELGLFVRITTEIHVAHAEALRPNHGIQRSQKFMGDVLADK